MAGIRGSIRRSLRKLMIRKRFMGLRGRVIPGLKDNTNMKNKGWISNFLRDIFLSLPPITASYTRRPSRHKNAPTPLLCSLVSANRTS
jgi:hypothetical protein